MPHIVLETTSDLSENGQIPDILEALVERLCSLPTMKSSAVKAYHSLRPNWHMGAGAPPGFAHCTVCILTGRSLALRETISIEMYDELRLQFAQSLESEEVALSLEVREMEKETYRN
jgi:5-carboxymethyl-2-hydroxymuconate isomerase